MDRAAFTDTEADPKRWLLGGGFEVLGRAHGLDEDRLARSLRGKAKEKLAEKVKDLPKELVDDKLKEGTKSVAAANGGGERAKDRSE